MENNHKCPAVVVHCMDFRFRKMLNGFLSLRFPEGYDLISVAGGVKNLDFILEQLKISHALHKPDAIVLIQHEDCGAYGGSKAFGDFSIEKVAQNKELKKAEALLKEQFSQPVEKYLARLSGEFLLG